MKRNEKEWKRVMNIKWPANWPMCKEVVAVRVLVRLRWVVGVRWAAGAERRTEPWVASSARPSVRSARATTGCIRLMASCAEDRPRRRRRFRHGFSYSRPCCLPTDPGWNDPADERRWVGRDGIIRLGNLDSTRLIRRPESVKGARWMRRWKKREVGSRPDSAGSFRRSHLRPMRAGAAIPGTCQVLPRRTNSVTELLLDRREVLPPIKQQQQQQCFMFHVSCLICFIDYHQDAYDATMSNYLA